MEEKVPWLLFQDGRKTFLFAADSKAFFLIEVNRNLSFEAEELLAQRGVSEEFLVELNLTHKSLLRNQIRGVGIEGCFAGDSVYLYLKSGKRIRYVLSDDYTEEAVDEFFLGVERFLPPNEKAQKGNSQDWRSMNRDRELYNKLFFVSPLLCGICAFFSIGYLLKGGWFWYLGCLICMLVPVVLDITMPAYFTLMYPEKGKRSDARELGWPLFVHMFALILLPGKNWLNENLFFAVWGIAGGSLVLILGLFAEEFKRKRVGLLAVFLIAGILGTIVAGHMNEAFDFSEPSTYCLEVENLKDSHNRRNSTYQCTVTLPDGRQVDLEIARGFYNDLEIGEYVLVEHSVGALGIEYANAYPMK